MYKRYLEPDEEHSSLTKYMIKKIKLNRNSYSRSTTVTVSANADTTLNEVEATPSFDNAPTGDEILPDINGGPEINCNEGANKQELTNDDFFQSINGQIIHPNLKCETADAIIMILSYFLKHSLTWVALEDLLDLFHSILGEESNLPRTKYFFKKCFDPDQKSVFHFFCNKCMLYIGDYEEFKTRIGDGSCITCTVCSSENSLKKLNCGNFYIQLPIRDQLVKKINEHDALNYNTTSTSGCISDIFDGELYKSLRCKVGPVPLITLTLNTDGVRVFKSKKKASLWPIQMYINEVSPTKRFKTDNIILSGIWFSKDPKFELYFQPLIKELNDLEQNKIIILLNNVMNAVTVRVLFISCDLPAKSKLMKMKQFNGKFGCTYCHHPGFRVDEATTRKYILSSEEYSLRTHESTTALIKSYIETGMESFGVTGVSPVIGFKDYDLIRGTVIDYLHCILEGVTELLMDLWFDSTNHRLPHYIIPRLQEIIERNMKAITPLRTFSIKPRPIADKNWWKAHEYKYWLLFYAVPCLKGIMKPIYLDHFSLLSEAIFIFLKSSITPVDYQKASKNLAKFHNDFERHYGKSNMMHNVHLLKHIPKCVKDCGPLWAYSNFNFESSNGLLVKHVKGTTDVEQQILSKYGFNNVFASLKNLSETTSSYIDRCRSMRVKKSIKLGQITLFGSPHKHKLDDNQKHKLLHESDFIMAYYKFFYENDIYFSSTYKLAEQTNDTIVMLKDKRIGVIDLIFENHKEVSLLLKLLHVDSDNQLPMHFKTIRKNVTDEFVVVKAEEIIRKLLLISTKNDMYLSELPNQYEGD